MKKIDVLKIVEEKEKAIEKYENDIDDSESHVNKRVRALCHLYDHEPNTIINERDKGWDSFREFLNARIPYRGFDNHFWDEEQIYVDLVFSYDGDIDKTLRLTWDEFEMSDKQWEDYIDTKIQGIKDKLQEELEKEKQEEYKKFIELNNKYGN